MPTKKCPVCGVAVKVENLERHVRNQHPKAHVEPASLLTEEERKEVEQARASSRPGLTSSGKRALAIVAIVIVAVLVVAVIAATWHGPGINVGEVAPDFTVTTSTGTSVTLSQYRGQPVLLEFMNTLCPACNNEAPILSSLYPAFSTRVHFFSVDIALPGDLPLNSASDIQAFKSKYNTVWEYGIDSNGKVADAYGVHATPTIFILDAKGVVAVLPQYNTGGDSYAALSASLNRTLG